MGPEFSKSTVTNLSTLIISFLIFLLIQKFVNGVFFAHSGNLLSRTEQAKPWTNIWSEAKRKVKNPFLFS